MGAVKNLCKRGIVLDQGQVAFDGGVEEAVKHYTNKTDFTATTNIVDNIKSKIDGLKITKMSFNGSSSVQSTISNGQELVDVLIEGDTKYALQDADVIVVFRKTNGEASATFSEGHYKARTHTILPGKFSIHKEIYIPKYIAQGQYIVDICIHKPNSCFYMNASACAFVQIEGGCDKYGYALIAQRDGFLGLESK